MLTENYKLTASREYISHIKDVKNKMDDLNEMSFIIGLIGKDEKHFIKLNKAKIDQYEKELREASKALGHVNGYPGMILEMSAIEGKNYARIGWELGYEVSSIKRKAKKGLIELYDYLPIDYK